MLTSLHIENIALIRRLDLEPSAGFCAFTGETGAGKSILIDAIGLLCGARGERELIRSGEDFAFAGQINSEAGICFVMELSQVEHFTGLTISFQVIH